MGLMSNGSETLVTQGPDAAHQPAFVSPSAEAGRQLSDQKQPQVSCFGHLHFAKDETKAWRAR